MTTASKGWQRASRVGLCSALLILLMLTVGCENDNENAPPRPTPTATATPSATPTVPPTLTPPAQCAAVMNESTFCLTTTDGVVALLGLDSGALCPLTFTSAALDGARSIAWIDDAIYFCGTDGVSRLALKDGSVEGSGVPCQGVAAAYGDKLLVRTAYGKPAPLRLYENFDAILARRPTTRYADADEAPIVTTQGDTAYQTYGYEEVALTDLVSGKMAKERLYLERTGSVTGTAATRDGLFVVASTNGSTSGKVEVFDAFSGHRLWELSLPRALTGLACVSHNPPVDTPAPTATRAPTPTPRPDQRPMRSSSCDEIGRSALDPAFRLELPASVTGNSTCSDRYQPSNYVTPPDLLPDDAEELHVISIGAGPVNPGRRLIRQGLVPVLVHPRPKPIVLVLSASSPTVWSLTIEPGARVARVILQGYGDQEVTGAPPDAPVVQEEPSELCGSPASGWEARYGSAYPIMISEIRDITQMRETSFQGCYGGVRFEIPHWAGDPPIAKPPPVRLDETVPREQVEFPGCEAVTGESEYCLTTTYRGPALLGLESGTLCQVIDGDSTSFYPGSIAWRGQALYLCADDGLTRISLLDGSSETPQVPCRAVTNYGDGFVIAYDRAYYDETPVAFYSLADYGAVLAGRFAAVGSLTDSVDLIAVHGGTLHVFSRAETGIVEMFDLATGALKGRLELEGEYDYVNGFAVTDGGDVVISGYDYGDSRGSPYFVRVFDGETGQKLRDHRLELPPDGLSCVTR